jgi:hypothetical protein
MLLKAVTADATKLMVAGLLWRNFLSEMPSESSWLLLTVRKFHKGGDGSRGPFFGCFEGGAALDKEPSGFSVHLISLRNSSETSD